MSLNIIISQLQSKTITKNILKIGFLIFLSFFAQAQEVSLMPQSVVAPPIASQDGSANLNYPIALPEGLNGMTPVISVHYNSDAGNSWMGIGWNIGLPAIYLDTRWGVPRFDADKESELYNLFGEQLMYPDNFLPHRHKVIDGLYTTEGQNRTEFLDGSGTTAIKTFHPRRKETYAKIERIGNCPINYYWKVTNMDGSISWFGGDEDGLDNSYVTKTGTNIAFWALKKRVDTHGYFIKYEYQAGNMPTGNLAGGIHLYLKKISYTGLQKINNGAVQILKQPMHEILFDLDNGSSRLDKSISARYGYKDVVIHRLSQIIVNELFNSSTTQIRKYAFTYQNGAFGKTVLKKIDEYKGVNKKVFTHTFDYHQPPKLNGNNGIFVSRTISAPEIDTNMLLNLDSPLKISRLGTTENSGIGGELNFSGGAGISWQNMSPGGTFINIPLYDLKANFTSGKTTLIDINGDGLQDILYKDSNGNLKFYENTCDDCKNEFKLIYNPSANISYGSSKSLSGVNHFLKGEGEQRAGTINGLFGFSMEYLFARFGVKNYKSKSRISHYMTDANGDMLPDFVVKNDDTSLVYFNRLVNGVPTFTTSSEPTENMLIVADIIQPEAEADTNYNEDEPEMEYDAVKVYSYDPSHKLKGFTVNVSLDNSNELQVGDEVKVSIEAFDETPIVSPGHRQIFSGILTKNNPSLTFTTNSNHHDIGENSYQYFYRTHSSEKNPKVNWDVDYLYTDCGNLDGNSNHCNEIPKLKDNFFLSNTGGYPLKFTGNGIISWPNINLPTPISDVLVLKIIKNTYNQNGEILGQQIIYNTTNNSGTDELHAGYVNFTTTYNYNQQTGEMTYDELEFKLLSVTNLKWHEIDWAPKITYSGTVNNGGESQAISGEKYVIPQHSIYHREYDQEGELLNDPFNRTMYLNETFVPTAHQTKITPKTYYNNINIGNDVSGVIYLTVKQYGQQIAQQKLIVSNGGISFNPTQRIGLTGTGSLSTDQFYITFSTNDELDNNTPGLLQKFINAHSVFNYEFFDAENGIAPNPNFLSQVNSTYRGQNYIGGGQFFYNPELASSTTPVDADGDKLIDISALNSTSLTAAIFAIIEGVGDPEDYATPEEYEQAILDALGLNEDNPIETGEIEDYLAGLGISDIDDLWELLGGMNHCILPTTPFRKKEGNEFIDKWIGFHEDMYVDKTSAKAGKFDILNGPFNNTGIGDPEPEPFDPQQADLETGMSAISLYGTGKYKSKRLFIWSESKGHNEYSTRFVDLNGDRYPEIIYNNKIYYTTMTGGQKNAVISPTIGSSHLEYIESDVEGKSISRSFNSSDISNLSSSIDNAKNGWVAKEKNGDQNNAAARVGLSHDDLDGDIIQKELWMDINGDGFTDWIINDGGIYKIHYSMGQSMSVTPVTVNAGYSPPNTSPEGGTGVNIGGGFGGILGQMGETGGVSGMVDVSVGGSFSQSNVKVQFVDINNDGLIDFIYEEDGKLYVKYNLGNAFTSQGEILANTSNHHFSLKEFSKDASAAASITVGIVFSWNFVIWVIPAYVKVGGWLMFNGNITSSEINKMFRDINGDGFPDLIVDQDNGFIVYNSKMGQVNKLKDVSTSMGDGFQLNFIPVGNTYDMPINKWVLNNVTEVKYHNPEKSIAINQFYEYKNGHYDRREREFYGFELVKSFTSPKTLMQANSMNESAFRATIEGETINKYYNKSYYLKGKLKEQYVIKNDYDLGLNLESIPTNRIHSKIKNYYSLKPPTSEGLIDMTATSLPETYDIGGKEGRGTAAAVLQKTEAKLFEYGANPVTTTTEYIFDGYKRLQSQKNVEENILQEFYYPDDLLSEPFMQDLVDNFRLGAPVKSEVKEAGVTLITQSSDYDSSTATQNQLRAVSSSSSKGSNPLEIKSTIDKYDDAGHILQQSLPGGKPTSVIWGYNDRYPIVTIEGLGYDELPASLVNQIRSISSTSPEDEASLLVKINELRTHSNLSSKALITAYTYYPNTGVRTVISSNGLKTTYTYYTNGKLKEVIDSNGKVIQEFKYNYIDIDLND